MPNVLRITPVGPAFIAVGSGGPLQETPGPASGLADAVVEATNERVEEV